MNNKQYAIESLVVRGNTKFQEIQLQPIQRTFVPKLSVIKMRGLYQIVEMVRQADSQNKLCQQCTDRATLPQVPVVQSFVCYPPRVEIQPRKQYEKKSSAIKKSFTEDQYQIVKKSSEQVLPRKVFTIKRAITSTTKNDESVRDVSRSASKNRLNDSKEKEPQQKIVIKFDMTNLLSYTNYLEVQPPLKGMYKAIITKGNNGSIIRQCLKSRSWWTLLEMGDELDDINLYWTQLRKQPFYGLLKQYITQKQVFTKVQKKLIQDKFNYQLKSQMYDLFDQSQTLQVHNHLECNFQVCNKKALFYNMKQYYTSINQDPFKFIPKTFHIQNGSYDSQYMEFEDYAKQNQIKTWIIKPGEQSNRGNGIELANSISEVRRMVQSKETHANGIPKTYIVQQYISKPLLYNKRKFDIRCYMLVTSINKELKAYFYQEGYIRTSCKEFNLEDTDCKYIHLTNDAVQKKSNLYGKYETANKVSYKEFQNYLQENHNYDFNIIKEQIKSMATDIVSATCQHLDPNHHFYSFELFGLDFMIDDDLKPWLIEVNTNPCLEVCCPLLSRIISHLIENTLRIAVDPMFPPPLHKKKTQLQDFKNYFDLIYSDTLIKEKNLPKILQDDDEEEVEDDN